jgi:hypothetical protein
MSEPNIGATALHEDRNSSFWHRFNELIAVPNLDWFAARKQAEMLDQSAMGRTYTALKTDKLAKSEIKGGTNKCVYQNSRREQRFTAPAGVTIGWVRE